MAPDPPEDEWGHWENESDSDSENSGFESSGSDTQNDASMGARSSTTASTSSTAGLAELNSWMHDSCELGVAAWMKAGEANSSGRRRCYFTTGGDFRSGSDASSKSGKSSSGSDGESSGSDRSRRPPVAGSAASRRPGRRRPGRQMPQQLWCVTPFERRQVDRWHLLETALTPRLCPRVFSRQFLGRPQTAGVVVGVSLGSIRVVQHKLTGFRHVEFLLMVSVGDRCRRAWRSHGHFARHARRSYGGWAAPCKAAWCVAESERRWRNHVDDYPYIAARHAAYEALLREVLFHADSPDEVLELSGASPGEGPLGAPEEAVLFGVEVPPAEAAAPCACRPPTPTLAARALELVRPSRREPTATRVVAASPAPKRPSYACLPPGFGSACLLCDGEGDDGGRDVAYRSRSSETVGAENAKPPLALALGEANGRRSEAHPLFTKLGKAVPFAVDAVARAIA